MKLSIIIVEYHCMRQVEKCIESIDKHLTEIEKECLVVSNSRYSKDELHAQTKRMTGADVIIDTHDNLGYAGGVNIGIKQAKGEYIYVLNPDCLFADSNVVQIIAEMDKNSKWAIAGPMVIDENHVIQPSCRRFPKLWTFLLVRTGFSMLPGAGKERARYLMEDFDRKSVRKVEWVSGGAMLVKASAIEKIGGMDERYFLYMEDVDWCRSCWDKDLEVRYDPVSVVIHAGQHQSIYGGFFRKLTSKHTHMHLVSMFKYFLKWKLR